jgi:peptidylprolyl isomerase
MTSAAELSDGLYARFDTTKGQITARLFFNRAPMTVGNFVGLAEGKLPYTNPESGKAGKGPFYDGLIFHRVIADFMIQGGDPTGTGRGGPGYRFEDEFGSGRKFDRAGILAMANAGPRTNGSQFFITHVPTPHLNNKHTIFGLVREGQDIVDSVQQGDTLESLEIKGDASTLLEAQKQRVAEWNRALESR